MTYFKHINAANFDRFFDQLKRLKNHGATELVMVEAAKTQRNMGGMGWYNCQTMCRDIARIETGFVINPWHLARKLDTDSANYRVIRRIKL